MRTASLHIPAIVNDPANGIEAIKESIFKTLTYFDIFQYPLTSGEIRQFLDRRTNEIELHEALTGLLREKRVFLEEDYFSIQDNPLLVIRRKKGNKKAEKLLKKARHIGRFLYRFPFVRAVAISGSLSKNYADENADIDFFIITKANRLWIARTFMHLYKKLTFLTGRQHYYCMNYYLDEEALYLEEQNIFSAIEIKTLVPVSGADMMESFLLVNNWTDQWFPALEYKTIHGKEPMTTIKRFIEWLLQGNTGTSIEKHLMKITQQRWLRKESKGKRNTKGQTMGFISGRHFAMSNPGNFREKVLCLYRQKLGENKITQKTFPISVVR